MSVGKLKVDRDDMDTFIQQQATRTTLLSEAVYLEAEAAVESDPEIRRVSQNFKRAINVIVSSLAYHINERLRGMGGEGVTLPSADRHTRVLGKFKDKFLHRIPGRKLLEAAANILKRAGYLEIQPGYRGSNPGNRARQLIPTLKFAELQRKIGWDNADEGNAEEEVPLVKINDVDHKRRDLSPLELDLHIVKQSQALVKRINAHNNQFKWFILNCEHRLVCSTKQTDRYLTPLLGRKVEPYFSLGNKQHITEGEFMYNNLGKCHESAGAVEIMQSKIHYQRIFSGNSFEQCGRFFNSLQRQVHRAHRNCIVVKYNNEFMPLVELDYGQIHPRIAYAAERQLAGLKELAIPGGGIYQLDNDSLPRDLIKAVFLVLMNIGPEETADDKGEIIIKLSSIKSLAGAVNRRWRKARTKAINEYLFKQAYGLETSKDPTQLALGWSHEDIERCRQEIMSRHSVISNWLDRRKGSHLMFLESQMTAYVAKAMAKEGYPFLLVHDAIFTVDLPEATSFLEASMREAFYHVTKIQLDENGITTDKRHPPQQLFNQFKENMK
jgi:hypothetical protein